MIVAPQHHARRAWRPDLKAQEVALQGGGVARLRRVKQRMQSEGGLVGVRVRVRVGVRVRVRDSG